MPKCKHCHHKFTPKYFNQKYCLQNDECLKAFTDFAKEQSWKQKKKELKQNLKTHKDYLNELQRVFNTYIRQRDRGKTCICCDKPLTGKYDAGHFYSVKSSSALRFDEDNVHGQTVHCNRDLHGNLIEYGIRLQKRIGIERFKALEEKRHNTVKLTIPEIKEKIEYYKNKIKKHNDKQFMKAKRQTKESLRI